MPRSIFPSAALLGVAIGLAGCGEMVFKRGADPGSMTAAQADCRAAGDAGYVACMEGKGFLVKGSQDSVFVEGLMPTPVAGTAVPAAPAATTGMAASPGRTPVETPGGKPASPPSQPRPQPVDPLERVRVGSWWKLGGNPDQLAAAQVKCVETLGVDHRPVPDSNEVTRAMVACLRDAGWRGLGN